MLKKLIYMGLTKNQAIIYLALVQKPNQSAGSVAKHVSMDRSFVYGILNSLANKGLVGYIVSENRRAYSASHPENLIKNIEEKQAIATSLIAELQTFCQDKQEERSVKVYEGKSALKVMARAVLDEDNFCVLAGGVGQLTLKNLHYELPHYVRELKKKKIKAKVLVSENNSSSLEKFLDISSIKIRVLKRNTTKATFILFGNKTAMYSLGEKPIVIIIEDSNITKALQTYFDVLWEIADC